MWEMFRKIGYIYYICTGDGGILHKVSNEQHFNSMG